MELSKERVLHSTLPETGETWSKVRTICWYRALEMASQRTDCLLMLDIETEKSLSLTHIQLETITAQACMKVERKVTKEITIRVRLGLLL